MKKSLLFLFMINLGVSVFAQHTFYTSFDKNTEKYYPTTQPEEAKYVMQLQRPQWVEGLSGRALDLSENAVLRMPLVVDSVETPAYGEKDDLTVEVWVKTIKNARQGTPITGNLLNGERKAAGWSLFTKADGAWGVCLSDGKNAYTYQPHAPQQAINDGQWHQLAFSINRDKGEVWFYFDGKNVAIYNISGLGNISSKNRTVIGGTDGYWEYGSKGQWMAFNGYLDEVKISNQYYNSETINQSYKRYRMPEEPAKLNAPLRTMVWNIWHGGRRYGQHVGVQRVIETIQKAQPDVVGLIETYGSGEIIADSLGYHFYLISSNLSIMSRFPIKETIKAFRSFNFGGAVLDLGNERELVFLDTWLHYLPDYALDIVKKEMTSKQLINAEAKTRHSEVKSILKAIKPLITNSNNVPVIMMGDFNCGSHLDWVEETKQIHHNYVIEWPVSIEMEKAGFKDSYRDLHVNPLLDPGLTWTPRASTSSDKYGLRDRIDYIYYQGNIEPIESKLIDYHPIMFPSDHAGVISVFKL